MKATLKLLLLLCALQVALCYIPVYVMLELDTVNNGNYINNPTLLLSQLKTLKSGGVDGIMTDTWWGIVENAGPKQYNWAAYIQLAEMAQTVGLKLQMVTSFHSCGGNVGDACNIPLPQWVGSIGQNNPDIYYKDSNNSPDNEYLSLGIDHTPVLNGRTAVQVYADFMSSMKSTFSRFMPNTINQIQVGLGPAGEMRYPAYQTNKWTYCGIGAFQCFDRYMLQNLSRSLNVNPPSNAGSYNSLPSQTQFFTPNQPYNYASDFGSKFLSWYSGMLLSHGETILRIARNTFPSSVSIAAKVSGVHWWYQSDSHAAEVTAGYYNTNFNNAYYEIASMLKRTGAIFDFTCLEMTDSQNDCGSAPEQLVKQTRLASNQAGIGFGGENALEICNPNCYQSGFDQVVKASTQYGRIEQFTYLRLRNKLLSGENWSMFTNFVNTMHSS